MAAISSLTLLVSNTRAVTTREYPHKLSQTYGHLRAGQHEGSNDEKISALTLTNTWLLACGTIDENLQTDQAVSVMIQAVCSNLSSAALEAAHDKLA